MQQQVKKPQRQWYTTSVETLRGLGLLVLVVLGVAGWFGYPRWETYRLRTQAAASIDEAATLIQRLAGGQAANSFETEYQAAW